MLSGSKHSRVFGFRVPPPPRRRRRWSTLSVYMSSEHSAFLPRDSGSTAKRDRLFELQTQPFCQQAAAAAPPPVEHTGYSCDGCGAAPIVGPPPHSGNLCLSPLTSGSRFPILNTKY